VVSTSSAHPTQDHGEFLSQTLRPATHALKTRTPRVWGLRGALIPLPTLRDWQLLITFQKQFHARSMRMFTKQ
jgi:hypothetical protein